MKATLTVWPRGRFGDRVIVPDVEAADEAEMAQIVFSRLRLALKEAGFVIATSTEIQDVEIKND